MASNEELRNALEKFFENMAYRVLVKVLTIAFGKDLAGSAVDVGHLCVGTGHGWEKVLEEEEEFLYPTPT